MFTGIIQMVSRCFGAETPKACITTEKPQAISTFPSKERAFEELLNILCDGSQPWEIRDNACTEIALKLVEGDFDKMRSSRRALFSLLTPRDEKEFHKRLDRIEQTPKIYQRVLTLETKFQRSQVDTPNLDFQDICFSLGAIRGRASAQALIDTFSDALDYRDSSQFLKARGRCVRSLLGAIKDNPEDPRILVYLNEDICIEKISKSHIGVKTARGMLLFNKADEHKLSEDLERLKFENLNCSAEYLKALLHKTVLNNPPGYTEELQGNAAKQIASYCQGELSEKQISICRVDNLAHSDKDDLADLIRLTSFPLNRIVTHIIGIDLSVLSFREQFYLLNNLKEEPSDNVLEIANILKDYGIEGVKAFLALEYLGSNAKSLIKLFQDMDQSRKLIKEFSRAIDALDKFYSKMQDGVLSSENRKLITDNMLDYLHEAFLRRCCDVMLATLASEGSQDVDMSKIKKAEVALSGMRLLFEVLTIGPESGKYDIQRWDPESRDSHPDNLIFEIKDKVTGAELRLKMLFRASENPSGEARWNMELNFDRYSSNPELQQAFKHTVSYVGPPPKQKTASTLRCGLDLTRSGVVSLDIGRSAYQGKSFSTEGCVIGELMSDSSAWNQGHHNSLSFPSSMSDPKVFSGLIHSLKEYFLSQVVHGAASSITSRE